MEIKKLLISYLLAIPFVLVTAFLPSVTQALILYDGSQTGGVTNNDAFTIDYDQSSAGNIDLQFGTNTRFLRWTGTKFQVSNDLDLNSNQITSARIENVTALPGGAVGPGVGAVGRIVQLTAIDSIAPGCTGPSCAVGSYSWDGTIWHSLQGNITTSNATKIITVGPVGRDYTTIAAGAAYLNTLSGGEMWIDPGTFPVTTVVDLSNIKLRGADLDNLTNINLSGGGKFLVYTSKFEMVTITIDAGLTAAMGLDVQYNAANHSAIEFSQTNFIINGSKTALNSTAGTAPYLVATFNICTESGTGQLLNSVAGSNLNPSSYLTVINLLSTNPLKITDWPVTIIGGSNVVTSGTITSVPDRTILVSPGMNIQGAINSLGASGGVIKLLVGTHEITNEILVANNNIKITGEGPGTVVRVVTANWLGGTTNNNCAIQIGAATGASPRTNIIVDSFKLQVGPNIHGLCVNGGTENKVLDMVVQSIGPKSSTRTAIVFTDGSVTAGARFTASRNIVNADIPANRWVDGVHFDGNAALPGQLFGYGNGISDSIISEMVVNEASETSYAFAQVSASSIFSNRARNTTFSATAFGMYFNNDTDIQVINNTIEGANAAGTGLSLADNVDTSTFIGNAIRGGPSNFNIGINIANSASTRNIIANNQIENSVTKISNSGTNTKLETLHTRSTVNPTATDDITDGFDVGTIWINTAAQTTFVSVVSTAGAAVWTALLSGNIGGTTSNTFVLDTDDTGGNVVLQFGQTLNERLTWNTANSHFLFSDAVDISGAVGVQAGNLVLAAAPGTVNNAAIPNNSFVRITGPTSNFTLTGFTGGYDGRVLILANTTSQNMTLSNLTGSSAGNQIITSTGGNQTTAGTGIAILVYDATTLAWRIIAFTP